MNDWYQRMVAVLRLNGKGEPTQKAYTRAVRMLSQFYDKTPDLGSETELQEYFLHRKNVNRWSPKTTRICYCGIRFFYVNVLARDWHILSILRAQTEHRLPTVLSVEEVRGILAHVKTLHNHAYLSTVYSCGLRLDEGRHLEVSDIDSKRMMIHVHRGKGAKDRYVPLPQSTLQLLRQYWLTHHHPRLVFPALCRKRTDVKAALGPMAKSSVQGAFRQAKRAAEGWIPLAMLGIDEDGRLMAQPLREHAHGSGIEKFLRRVMDKAARMYNDGPPPLSRSIH